MFDSICPVVLIIDPDALTLMGLSATLHHQKMEVHGARSATAAIKAAESLALDLVVIDDWIDECYGFELLETLRTFPHLTDLPAIFLFDPQTDKPRLPMSSFSVFKPLDLESLTSMVKRALVLPHLVHQPMTLRGPMSSQIAARTSVVGSVPVGPSQPPFNRNTVQFSFNRDAKQSWATIQLT